MNKKVSSKCNGYMTAFKKDIKDHILGLDLSDSASVSQLIQYIYDYPPLEITKDDLLRRKRVKNNVPFHERCRAKRAPGNGSKGDNQCTRRKKKSEEFCGTHIKGRPHGEIDSEPDIPDTDTIQVWAQDIAGIIYYLDYNGNVYDPQDVHENKKDPRIIAKYQKQDDGTFVIPAFI